MTSFHDPMLRGKDAGSFVPDWSQSIKGSDDAPQLRARWVAQVVTNTSTSLRRLTWR